MRTKTIRLEDGFNYAIYGDGTVMGQVHRDSDVMDVVVEPSVIAEVKRRLTPAIGRFLVGCRVSGGVTGTRQSILKEHGINVRFATREAAQAKADELKRKMNSRFSVASFSYWVEEDVHGG
jgi:hypothetical protein